MAEIRVNYRRVWQVKPFETESIELGVEETINVQGDTGETAKTVSSSIAEIEAIFYRQLAEMADQLMVERLEKHKAQGF